MSTSARAWLEPDKSSPGRSSVVVDRGPVEGEVEVGSANIMPDGGIDLTVELHYREWVPLLRATFPNARIGA